MNVLMHPVNVFTDDQRCQLGQEVTLGDGRVFVYTQFKDALAYISGALCYQKDGDGGTVTGDESAGNDRPAGVVCASERTATQRVPTEGQYGYVQRTGWHPAVSKMAGVDSIADGTPLTAHASADHDVTIYTATPTTAEILRRVGAAAGASEDGTSGTYNEDTVPMNLQIPAWTSARS